ncbi:MAG: LCP family protein [Candidatus Saganbacteria bacterium]|nr:LCP family protein [Candidatus Saganbacteria bacterium]
MKHADHLRLIALIFIVVAVVHFFIMIFIPQILPPFLKLGVPGRPLNILLVGKDLIYDIDGKVISALGNTDTLEIIHINPVTNKILLYSIPRDTVVDIPGYGNHKINAAYNLGGIKLLKESVIKLTGARIDGYIMVNTRFLEETIDILGGIKIYVDKDMDYDDNAAKLHIHLKQGDQKLTGKQAMGFVRFRMEAMGDLSRIDRQQRFMKSFFGKLRNIGSIPRLPLVLIGAYHHTQTDLSLKKILQIANFVRTIRLGSIQNYTLEGEQVDHTYLGSVIMPKSTEIEKFVKTNL